MKIEEVWTDYETNIKSFLHARISNWDDVDDLLQEILIRTYKNLHTVKSETSIKAWLFQIANHAIIDFYRKKGSLTETNTDELWYGEDNADMLQELSRCIEPFINELPEELAELLKAIDIEGQSQKDYAQRHGLSYSTLKSRVQKGRRELRKVFNECCHFSLDKQGNILEFTGKSDHCKNC